MGTREIRIQRPLPLSRRNGDISDKGSCSENEEITADLRYILQVESTGVYKLGITGEDKR